MPAPGSRGRPSGSRLRQIIPNSVGATAHVSRFGGVFDTTALLSQVILEVWNETKTLSECKRSVSQVDKICPPLPLPERHPGMSKAERPGRLRKAKEDGERGREIQLAWQAFCTNGPWCDCESRKPTSQIDQLTGISGCSSCRSTFMRSRTSAACSDTRPSAPAEDVHYTSGCPKGKTHLEGTPPFFFFFKFSFRFGVESLVLRLSRPPRRQ